MSELDFPHLHQVVSTSAGFVEYSEAGSGEPILYFHGTGITGELMLTVERDLIDAGFRLIVPNRPGYGQTPLGSHRSSAGCATVAEALLDPLGVRSVHVMGSSGGAAFAVSFAIQHPDRVRSLVLLCPQLHRWDDKRWLPKSSRWTLPFLRRRMLRSVLLKFYRFGLRRMSATQFLKNEAGDRYAEIADNLTAQDLAASTLAAMAIGVSFPGFANDFMIFTREEILPEGGFTLPPTLILHDPLDPLAPVEHVDWFVSRCPNCERVPLNAGGHLIWVGRDAERMREMRVRFLRRAADS